MKIRTNIQPVDSQYHVQVDTLCFSASEDEKLATLGEPTIDIGGDFTGSASRPGQTNTTAVIVPTSGQPGSGAVLAVVVGSNGTITSINVVSGGTNYTTCIVLITGDGESGAATATVVSGVITAVAVTDAGDGYNQVPRSVSFSLPSAIRRIRTDFPVVRVFDLADTSDADVMAKVFADTIVNRLTTAKNTLISMGTPFEGESLVTV